jgi:CBS domain-containing protein
MYAHDRLGAPACAIEDVPVGEVMHAGFIGCALETPLREVARLMAENRVHCVVGFGDLAEDDTCLWGVVSDLDLVSALASGASGQTSAGEIATTEVATVRPHESLRKAAQIMNDHEITHVLVLAAGSDRPVGVVSTLDIAAHVARLDAGGGGPGGRAGGAL